MSLTRGLDAGKEFEIASGGEACPLKKDMKTYISGAISGIPADEMKRKFEDAELSVAESGRVPVNPIKVCPFNPDYSWGDYMAEDIKALLECDAIVMLPCWGKSRGARIEHAIAKEIGLTVEYW